MILLKLGRKMAHFCHMHHSVSAFANMTAFHDTLGAAADKGALLSDPSWTKYKETMHGPTKQAFGVVIPNLEHKPFKRFPMLEYNFLLVDAEMFVDPEDPNENIEPPASFSDCSMYKWTALWLGDPRVRESTS